MTIFRLRIILLLSLLFAFFSLFTYAVFAQVGKGMEMSQSHKSIVADVIEELRMVAGKDQNIGEELREIAQEQEKSNERAVKAIESVETRGAFKTFLFGTDYKNIGVIRSELVTTDNHIDRLTNVINRSEDAEVKADLETQISALEETKTSAESFIKENEDKFSLLGWLVRLFN